MSTWGAGSWGGAPATPPPPAQPAPATPVQQPAASGWGSPGWGGGAPAPTQPAARDNVVQYPRDRSKPASDGQAQRSDLIVKAAMKGKFLDFRNGLVPALEKDYAMAHGIGGHDHAARSVIRLLLTDYSAGTGDRAVVVSTNVGPEFAPYVLSVCRANVGNIPPQAKRDFTYKQERVNVYKTLDGGYKPVSTLMVSRQGIRQTGEESRLPWCVQISQFEAMPKQQQNGTTAYVASTIRNKKEAFILISDEDMFRCLYRVERFTEMWEMSCALPLIRKAVADIEQNRGGSK